MTSPAAGTGRDEREIVLIRHATTADTRAGLFSGHGPTPLDERGAAQADALGVRLAPRSFALALISPVARTWETAARAGLLDHEHEAADALVEWRYGALEGRRNTDVRDEDPSWSLWVDGAPGGEAPAEVAERVRPVLDRLARTAGDVVVVSHGHVLRVLIAGWLGLAVAEAGGFVVDPASVSVLGHRHGRPVVVALNDRAHLTADLR